MKKLKNIVCFFIVISMLMLTLAGCGRGQLIATYTGGRVYQSDVEDWINFYITENMSTIQSDEDVSNVISYAIKLSVMYDVYEKELADNGVKINKKQLKEDAKAVIEGFNEYYSDKGGYQGWIDSHSVSKNFIYQFVKYQEISSLIQQYLLANYYFTEDDLYNYYKNNSTNYFVFEGYTCNGFMIEVKDLKDESEWNEAKEKAQDYIDRIMNGEDFDEVENEALTVYSEENGYSHAKLASGEDVIPLKDVEVIDDLDAKKAELAEFFKDINPDAEEGTEEYIKYMQYLGYLFQLDYMYTITHLIQPGEIYSQPIKCQYGYFILKLESYETNAHFQDFEDIKEKVKEDYLISVWNDGNGQVLIDYQEEMIKKYNVNFYAFSKTDTDTTSGN